MITRKGIFVWLMMVTGSLATEAQKTWTLNDCIAYAIQNNLSVYEAKLAEESAIQNYRQSKWNLLPGVSGNTSAGMNYGRSVDPNTSGIVNTSFFSNSYSVGASLDVFNGFALQNQISYQKFRKEAAENNRLNAVDDLAFSVMRAFFDVIYYQELLKIANEQKDVSVLNVKKTEVLVATGLKAQTDLLEVKANLEKDELFCIQTANNLETSWINLRKAMNIGPEERMELDNPASQVVVGDEMNVNIPELFQQHIQWSPYIRSYENEYLASRKNIAASRGNFFPSLSLKASYGTGYYETNTNELGDIIGFGEQIKNNRSEYLGASLSIPIFGRNAVRFNVKRAQIASDDAKARLELAKQTVLYEMVGNWNELSASWKEFQQAEKQMAADTLAFQAAQKKYDQGMINVVEFYTTKNRLATTAGQVLRSKLTLEIKKRIIDFYSGIRFWEQQ